MNGISRDYLIVCNHIVLYLVGIFNNDTKLQGIEQFSWRFALTKVIFHNNEYIPISSGINFSTL